MKIYEDLYEDQYEDIRVNKLVFYLHMKQLKVKDKWKKHRTDLNSAVPSRTKKRRKVYYSEIIRGLLA